MPLLSDIHGKMNCRWHSLFFLLYQVRPFFITLRLETTAQVKTMPGTDSGRLPCVRPGEFDHSVFKRHEFSKLVLLRMALLMDQSRSVLPLRLAKAREFGEL